MAKGQSAKASHPPKPRVVVGLDFGTVYSGFAYAHVSDPEKIYTFYDYPMSVGDKLYCKTLTACYYKPLTTPTNPGQRLISMGAHPKVRWKLQSWGYPARANYDRDIQALHTYQNLLIPSVHSKEPSSTGSSPGKEKFLSRFKLFRSSSQTRASDNDVLAPLIPKAPSVRGGFLSRWLKLFSSQDTSQPGASDGVAPLIPQVAPSVGVFLSRFKLHLASMSNTELASAATPLPLGLTVEQVITDYLRELGGLILKHLQNKYGVHFSAEMIQWCITVPSIWDDPAMATMRMCMTAAGLVSAYHSVTIVLEPEAASYHCQRVMREEVVLKVGQKLVVADIGGESSEFVVQKVVDEPLCRVKEVTTSSAGLCGGAYVDSRFMEFLKGKVGQACVSECIMKHRNVYEQLMKEWEVTKSIFDGSQDVYFMKLPNKLALEWERSGVESGHLRSRETYDELEISSKEMQSIFDPIVQQNVDLIQQQLVEACKPRVKRSGQRVEAKATGKVGVLAMVGGFSESPYLLRRMRETFGATTEMIICPPNPGSAICQGAVALVLNPNIGMLRTCKRTYGYQSAMPFEEGIDPIENLCCEEDGTPWCRNRFEVLLKKGDEIAMESSETLSFSPREKGCKSVTFRLFSCDDDVPPRYTTDSRLQKEGKLVLDISRDMKLDTSRDIELSLCFGVSSLKVQARALNFNAKQVELPVKVDYLLD